jgi:hypothetical protein
MITSLTFNLPIGTMLMGSDGFMPRLGRICDVETTRFGQHYVVVMADGSFESVHAVDDECSNRIGWPVASAEWIARLSS